jgi:hypothetical protein
MLRWLLARNLKGAVVEAETDAWMDRHGRFAYRLAGERAMDAYFLGDLAEQERWHEIRGTILERVAPQAGIEEATELLAAGSRDEPWAAGSRDES